MTEHDLSLAIVDLALAEDLPAGDVTADAIFPPDAEPATAQIITRENCVVVGEPVLACLAERFPSVRASVFRKDGETAAAGDVVYGLAGHPGELVKLERTLLNFVQRLSAVATRTRAVVDQLAGTGIRVLDTRKTTPGMRQLEKYAVRMGGGGNHRMSLSDGILIKENHIRAAGSITEAVRRCRSRAHHLLKVEVEVETLAELDEALAAGADGVLLDNMNPQQIAEACERKATHRFFIEVSGGLSPDKLDTLRGLPVDFVSMGALTHSAGIVDMTMLF